MSMCVCVFRRAMVRVVEGERGGDALTFNDALCNSTLEVIITNTMQVVTFDLTLAQRKRERRE